MVKLEASRVIFTTGSTSLTRFILRDKFPQFRLFLFTLLFYTFFVFIPVAFLALSLADFSLFLIFVWHLTLIIEGFDFQVKSEPLFIFFLGVDKTSRV